MKYELIFAAVALALLLGVVALFAWRLLMGRTDERREWARVEENVEALRTEYARILEQRSAGRLSESVCANRRHCSCAPARGGSSTTAAKFANSPSSNGSLNKLRLVTRTF